MIDTGFEKYYLVLMWYKSENYFLVGYRFEKCFVFWIICYMLQENCVFCFENRKAFLKRLRNEGLYINFLNQKGMFLKRIEMFRTYEVSLLTTLQLWKFGSAFYFLF
jgi:hypothetical protein